MAESATFDISLNLNGVKHTLLELTFDPTRPLGVADIVEDQQMAEADLEDRLDRCADAAAGVFTNDFGEVEKRVLAYAAGATDRLFSGPTSLTREQVEKRLCEMFVEADLDRRHAKPADDVEITECPIPDTINEAFGGLNEEAEEVLAFPRRSIRHRHDDRFGFDQEENIYFDRERPIPNRELFEEVTLATVIEAYDAVIADNVRAWGNCDDLTSQRDDAVEELKHVKGCLTVLQSGEIRDPKSLTYEGTSLDELVRAHATLGRIRDASAKALG